MRTSRIRTATLAAVTAALALGLTACGGADGGSKAAGGDHAAGSAPSRSASSGDGKGGAEQANGGGDNKEGARSATASGGTGEVASKDATAGAQQCRGDEMLLTAVHRFAGQQGDHLLLTASNEGTEPCWVTSYPAVKLGDVDGVALPHSKKDNPGGDKHLTLQPGGKAYSAVNLFDYGSKNHTAQSFALALRGADGHDGPFYSVHIKGEKPQFSWNEADVLNWNTEKPYDF
ncbi:DUF4232 domain-containing protein [Streptomyces sp. NPDC048650]|uniref:DUF4232 domain-containing protein n=1 Tax=Streptomyces sp. NPDC048650 TaxID=3365583 RepID=UPI0037113F97